jgi:hypothetical protein
MSLATLSRPEQAFPGPVLRGDDAEMIGLDHQLQAAFAGCRTANEAACRASGLYGRLFRDPGSAELPALASAHDAARQRHEAALARFEALIDRVAALRPVSPHATR